MNKKRNIKQYFKDLLFSFFDTPSLFKFAIYNWITPLIVLVITIGIMIAPSIIVYTTLEAEDITSNVIHLEKVFADLFKKGEFKCQVKDGLLKCDETYAFYDFKYVDTKTTETEDDDITTYYRVYVNSGISKIPAIEGYENTLKTDNYLILSENSFMYRYAHRDPITRTVSEYSLVSFYSDLEGFNFNDVNQTYHSFNNETDANNYLLDTANNFIEKGYKAVAHEMVFTNIVTSITSYLLFVLVASLLLKGIYLLKKNKGFKFTQSIKITLIASIQSLSIAIVLALSGMNFINALGISLAIRILYIYVRYTGSRKNTKWLEELYLLTNEERFKIANENTNNISK